MNKVRRRFEAALIVVQTGFVSLLITLLVATAQAQAPSVCAVSGTLYNPDATFAVGAQVRISRVSKNGVLIAPGPFTYTANASGVVTFNIIRGTTAYIYSTVAPYNVTGGVAIAVPDAATADLSTLATVAAVPTAGITVTTLANKEGTLTFSASHFTVSEPSAGIANIALIATPLVDPMTTRGDIIFRNASNVTARLAVGAADRVVTSNGTDPSYGQVTNAMLAGSIADSKLSTIATAGKVSDSALSSNIPLLNANNVFTGTLRALLWDKGGVVYNIKAYCVADGVTDDAAALSTLINTTIPAAGGIIEVPAGVTIAIASAITIGNGTSTTASTRHNVVIRGASGHLLNMAGALNPSGFKWTGASGGTMFTVTGPIGGVRFEHLLMDANSLANTAISSMGAEGLLIEDIKVINQRSFAFIVDYYEPAVAGNFDNANAPTFRNVYVNSTIAGSSFCNVAPTGTISQLTIDGVRTTLQGGSNIGLRLGYTDSNFIRGYVGDIQLRPVTGQATYPSSIKIDSMHGNITVDNALATWAPPTGRGVDIDTFATVDGETVPTDPNIRGITDGGLIFGEHTVRDALTLQGNATINGLLKAGTTPTTLTDAAGKILSVALNTVQPGVGGTGLTSYAVGDLIYASGATTLAKLADVAVGSVLVSGGVTTAPAYSASPTIATSLTVPLLFGGTALDSNIAIDGSINGTPSASNILLNASAGYAAGTAAVGAVRIGTPTGGTYRLVIASTDANLMRVVSTAASGSGAGAGIQTANAVTPSAAGHRLGFFTFGASNGIDGTQRNAILLGGYANEAWTDGSVQGAYLTIETTASGAASRTEKLRVTDVGNMKIGGTALRGTTEGTAQLVIFNGTNPAGTLTNGISMYARSGEAYIMDAAGNETIQSPHDLLTNEWIFYSKNTVTGKVLRVDMERLMKAIDMQMGGGFVHEYIEARGRK